MLYYYIFYYSFIVNMHYSFQDMNNIYLVMDLMTGGDLRFILLQQKNLMRNRQVNQFIIKK